MHFRTVMIVVFLAVSLLARVGEAQTSRPSNATGALPAVTSSPAADTVIRRPVNPGSATRPASTATAGTFDTRRIVLSLAIVLGLIFFLRWVSQRVFGRTMTNRSSRAVQVLTRNVISPKQQLLVVQVGRRLLVVGDSGQQMNALCEITDPDEMAALVGQIHEDKRESTSNAFGAIFGRAGSTFGDTPEPQRPVDVADEDDHSAGPPGVQDTRDELNGLMDKVRIMTRQFRRT